MSSGRSNGASGSCAIPLQLLALLSRPENSPGPPGLPPGEDSGFPPLARRASSRRPSSWERARLRRTQLLDLREQVVGDLDAPCACGLLGREAARTRKAHPSSASIVETMVSTRSQNLSMPGERAGVDRDEGLADARLVALLGEEGIGFGADRRAGERRADQLERRARASRPSRRRSGTGCRARSPPSGRWSACRGGRAPSLPGCVSPLRIAIMILPRTTVVSARSITIGRFALAREGAATGIGAEQRLACRPRAESPPANW